MLMLTPKHNDKISMLKIVHDPWLAGEVPEPYLVNVGDYGLNPLLVRFIHRLNITMMVI